ncbi:terminase large subunit domain-containing protein [Psychroflexus aestuariivivens]|uniref:terminase large subunit domain-containing protein n=1 Tax=Psychroflexus aestuariivivens TaxID=1795040 RepID=UPI000FD78A35|nr:terminase family protein [Psychroflexus aestuariivivens]
MLTDEEIYELEVLLRYQSLNTYDEYTNPNYKFLHQSIIEQKFSKLGKLLRGYAGCILEGSSRSGKTWSGVDIIIWLCTEVEENCRINIYRETYQSFEESLYDDFKRRLDDFDLPNPFHNAQKVKSFKIGNNVISFQGCDKIGKKHGSGADYVFFNELMHIPQNIFDHAEMRCRKFWWADYNPSFTDHWVFDKVTTRDDVGFLRTTFKQNKHISSPERRKILSYEPYKPNSYEIKNDDLYYNGEPISDKNQPPPHPKNVTSGTADPFMWKVYGLGLRGAMQGVIFTNVEWIDEFPDIDFTYANDFGFTADPNVLVRYAEDENNIYAEPLTYKAIETDEELSQILVDLDIERSKPIDCDSSDKHISENKGTIEMVKGLRKRGFNARKISKKKSVMYWILSMKKKKIHIVKNDFYKKVKKERENYTFKEVNGILINQPIDDFNHFWDAVRYGHISHNVSSKKHITNKSLAQMGVAY